VVDEVDYIEPDNVGSPSVTPHTPTNHQPAVDDAEYLAVAEENETSDLPEYMNFSPPALPPRR
jgi:hypothetical protein